MSVPELPPGSVMYDGMLLNAGEIKNIPGLLNLHTTTDDIFLATYPRSGTTWIGETMSLIQHKGDEAALKKKRHLERIIYVELEVPQRYNGVEKAEAAAGSRRILKTHLPYKYIKRQVEENNTKAVVVLRNVRDTVVSMCHFTRDMPKYKFSGTWGEYFEFFKHKRMAYGDWLDHAKSYWEVRHFENIHIIFYEDAVDDFKTIVRNLASFMGEELDEDTIGKMVKCLQFKEMKDRTENNSVLKTEFENMGIGVEKFFRKGGYGNWRHYFTKEQDDFVKENYDDRLDELGMNFKN